VSGSLTLAFDNAPAWASDPAARANVETIESAKTLNFAASSTLPCPRELTPQQCHAGPCVRPKSSLTGACVCNDFHHIGGDNPHFHLMTHDARH
jgi:hypothetical protein